MGEQTLDQQVVEILETVSEEVAQLIQLVVEREQHDRHNPQPTTPQDYANMAWKIKHGSTGRN